MKFKRTNYKRLNYNEIKTIIFSYYETKMNKPKFSIQEIAKKVKRDKKTVINVVKNYVCKEWVKMTLHQKASHVASKMKTNKKRQGRKSIIGSNPIVFDKLKVFITEQRKSPYQASIALKEELQINISKNSIYYFTKKTSRDLINFLPQQGKVRKQRVKHRRSRFNQGAPVKVNISQRSRLADQRLEFGHWECDTVVSCKNGSNYAVLSLIERVTRYKRYIRIPNLKSETVFAYLLPFLISLEKSSLKSITFDNGTEFSTKKTELLKKYFTELKLYYCNPYSSYEKGAVERSNLDLRRFYAKGTDFENVSSLDIKKAEKYINNYHLPVLNNKTPEVVFNQLVYSLRLAA